MDAFIRDKKVVAIFNIKRQWCSTCRLGVKWADAAWSVVINDIRSEGVVVHKTLVHYTLMVEFEFEGNFGGEAPTFFSVEASIDEHVFRYTQVPICKIFGIISEAYQYNLTACTSVQGSSKYQLPEWVKYNIRQGYQEISIFINEDPQETHFIMDPYNNNNNP